MKCLTRGSTFTDLSLSAVVLVALPKQLSADLRRREAAFDPDIVTNHSAAAGLLFHSQNTSPDTAAAMINLHQNIFRNISKDGAI